MVEKWVRYKLPEIYVWLYLTLFNLFIIACQVKKKDFVENYHWWSKVCVSLYQMTSRKLLSAHQKRGDFYLFLVGSIGQKAA